MSDSSQKLKIIKAISDLANEIINIEMLIVMDLSYVLKLLKESIKNEIQLSEKVKKEKQKLISELQNIDAIEQRLSHVVLFVNQLRYSITKRGVDFVENREKLELSSFLLMNTLNVYYNFVNTFQTTNESYLMLNITDNFFKNEKQLENSLDWCLNIGFPNVMNYTTECTGLNSTKILHCYKYYSMNSERESHREFIASKIGTQSMGSNGKKQFVDIEIF